ncbi:MAG: phosphoribosylformylglycinamidine synthase [Eubacteriales bacterium]|nr:phosphoribosylformylglycinamidine synthase [Eubacteriales bacterium]
MQDLIFVRRKAAYRAAEAAQLEALQELPDLEVKELALFNAYAVSEIKPEETEVLAKRVLSDPLVDEIWTPEQVREYCQGKSVLGVTFLPGQYDQRGDAAEQCLRLFFPETMARAQTASFYVTNSLDASGEKTLRGHFINPVECRELDLGQVLDRFESGQPAFGQEQVAKDKDVEVYQGFNQLDRKGLTKFLTDLSLAMSLEDLELIQGYFQKEGREPNALEIKVLDTYWSDHCRHTTFNTELLDIENKSQRFGKEIDQALELYHELRKDNGREEKPFTLMEMVTIMSRDLRHRGLLDAVEVSDEINACSIKVKAKNLKTGELEDWFVMFKNETHNHPTEIEPFGGAATCLGGCIRDPLSGRSWVYQALRLSGAGDINTPLDETLPGKLPQREISGRAAKGYSSYGNQIGLATTAVREFYHPGYVAKRLELGAVVAAVPAENLYRGQPREGDRIILLGGRTGRDGIGGATGSSKAHDEESLATSGAEVQKGNPVNERKIQRLFRHPEIAPLIRACNDFGAGGVCVAVGELADSLLIHLDRVPLKYAGLNPLEIAVSESQERMAVLLDPNDVAKFLAAAEEENLEATEIAEVTGDGRLRMVYGEQEVLDLERAFLDTNGAKRQQKVEIQDLPDANIYAGKAPSLQDLDKAELLGWLDQTNHGTQQGLVEQFDSSIGRSTVLFPYGGLYQKSEETVSAQSLPLEGGSATVSLMSYGYQPDLADDSPYLMGAYSLIEALAKLVAAGSDYREAFLTIQDYFERLDQDPIKWGKVLQAVLGNLEAQHAFQIAQIGGKDSMSGSFEDLHVPPTLVTFAVATLDQEQVISATLPYPQADSTPLYLYYLPHRPLTSGKPNYDQLKTQFDEFRQLAKLGLVKAASPVRSGGLVETLAKMSLGNQVGLVLLEQDVDFLANPQGGLVLASDQKITAGQLTFEGAEIIELGMTAAGLGGIAWREDLFTSFRELDAAMGEAYSHVFPAISSEDMSPRANLEDQPLYLPKESEIKPAPEQSEIWRVPEQSGIKSAPEQSGIRTVPEQAESKSAPEQTEIEPATELKKSVRVLLPVFPGSNCEFDTMEAFSAAGATCQTLLIRDLRPDLAARDQKAFLAALDESQILGFIGGFSYGDEPDGSAKFIVNFLKVPEISQAIKDFVARGGLVIGICNGFQALIKSGFLPYGDPDLQTADSPTLFFNQQGRHVSRIARTKLATDPARSPWLSGFQPGQIHQIPVSHGEGRFMVSAEEAEKLFAAGQVAFQYVDDQGNLAEAAPWNPNGSAYAIEGLISPDGRILGKMGHSERYRPGLLQNIPGMAVQNLFANAVEYLQEN